MTVAIGLTASKTDRGQRSGGLVTLKQTVTRSNAMQEYKHY